MTRRCSLEMLPRPNRRQRRKLRRIGFETLYDAEREDRKRAAGLRSQLVRGCDNVNLRGAKILADKLDPDGEREMDDRSLSSSRYSRRHRARLTWAIEAFFRENRREKCSFFTLAPRSGVTRAEALSQTDAKKIMKALLSDLNRCGAGPACGCLLAFIHGEFEPKREVFVIHVHGVAFGDMIGVVDKLRKRRKYRRVIGNDIDMVPIRRPVRMTRRPITNRLRTFSYLFKSYWPSRWRGAMKANGKFPRSGRAQRIPEPFHSKYLLWLDQYRPQDLALMIGMKATKNGLLRTRCSQK